MKDIFIDNNIASRHFSNPIDDEYEKLINWLDTRSDVKENDAHLVVSRFLINEYHDSNRNPASKTNIIWILDRMTKDDRLRTIGKKDIEAFQKEHFSKKVLKKLLSNAEDRNHIPAVLLSNRKMTLTEDNNFAHDLINFPHFDAVVAKRPEELAYKD